MSTESRSERARVRRFLTELKRSDWLGSARRWWPDYLFHVTNIQNAVSILREGGLFSRREAQERNLMVTDNASPQVIDQTEERWKDFARLYFRPRTPTHYRSEGFRTARELQLDAHCPVPVCLLFDSCSILPRTDVLFSDGNLASPRAHVFQTTAELEQLPFENIYHDSWFSDEHREQIRFNRNAEVVVPHHLDLDPLRFVACRTDAEYETLLHILPSHIRRQWEGNIGTAPRWNLFYKRWTFVDRVDMSSDGIVFVFNPDTESLGPFEAQLRVVDSQNLTRIDNSTKFTLTGKGRQVVKLDAMGPYGYYVSLFLDGHLAYASHYQGDDQYPW